MINKLSLVFFTTFAVSFASDVCEPVDLIDPAKFQLETYKQCSKGPTGYATTSSGQPVDIRDTNTLNTNLLLNNYFLDAISHSISERVPERVVHAKGTGAHGYFEVTHDITDICNADLFKAIGKKTPVTVRFSISLQDKGGSDTGRDVRGCGIKLYTDEGNLDFLSISVPVYLYRDPVLFPHLTHSFKRNPATHLFDPNAQWDLILLRPETIHLGLWLFSDYGIPNTYRHMSCFPIHTYEVVNKIGETFYIRFNFTTNEGIENLSTEESIRVGAADPDYFIRDLYNAIENKAFPSWTLYIDVLSEHDLEEINFDPFDVTRLWQKGTFKRYPVGLLTLNKNPKNNFAEVEQLAFNPGNLVPGIVGPPDKLFQGRVFAYGNTQNYRLGFNHNNILTNLPIYAKTYNRDGQPPVSDNMKDIPNYYPNSFNGPVPIVDKTRPKKRLTILESNAVDLEPAIEFYTQLNDDQKLRLVGNLVSSIALTTPSIQKRAVELFTKIHAELGRGIESGLQTANATAPMPINIIK